MEFNFVPEIFRLLICNNNKCPVHFVSFFNSSQSIIAFNYDCKIMKFTHFSDSFRSILGYKGNNVIKNGTFSKSIIHPHDNMKYQEYMQMIPGQELLPDLKYISSLKCRARHMKGYWKYFVIFSMSYQTSGSFFKIGIFLDQHQQGETLTILEQNNSEYHFQNPAPEFDDFINNSIKISPRENEVLEFISQGMIAKEIADKLNISTNTVISHRKNLINKFKVKNTAQLIKTASHLMLI